MKTTLLIWSIAVIAGSFAGAARAETNLLLVCNKGDQTISVFNPESGGEIAAVKEDGVTGHEVVASADGRLAFVPIYGNSGVGHPGTDGKVIRVIDLERRSIVGTVNFTKGVRPHCAVIGPKNHLLYVTTELDNSITVIDPKTFAILYSIPTGQIESHMLAITSDGNFGYTANVKPGTVSVLDLKARKVLKVIPVAKTTQRICISPDDRWVFTADQTKPQMAVIDVKTNQVDRWIELPGVGYGAATSPDNQWLVVAMSSIRKAGLVDLRTMKLVNTVDLPKNPQEVLIRPDGKVAYVSCDASMKVAAIDLKTFKVEQLIFAGKGADGLAWAVRP
jgi:YVTN family beta-propeller protein